VPDEVFDGLKHQLRTHALLEPTVDKHPTRVEDRVNRQLVEAAALVGGYNLVSRFLLALDVDDCASAPLPFVPPPAGSPDIHEYPVTVEPGVRIHIRVQFHHDAPKAPVLIFVNSLLTNRSMWDHVLPFFADKYTLISFDQRGHGKSTMPLPSDLLFSNSSSQYPPPSPAPITIKRLAQDVGFILDYLNFPRIHGIVGVSQGGATALSFAMQYPHRALRVVACDTQAAAPLSNRDAWESRIAVARGSAGMEELARQTAVRWFPSGSSFRAPALDAAEQRDSKDWDTLREMIAGTSIEGFAASARSLQAYDLRAEGLISTLQSVTSGEGVKENAMKVLLLAGSEDGKLPGSLKALRDEIGTENAQFTEIVGSGHLPMLDQPEEFARVLDEFLA
jgi:pimeloyl-ACP methyl ester carboxylesterase